MIPQPIACAIDGDILEGVARGESVNRNAIYDISVVRGLRRLGHRVCLVGAFSQGYKTIDALARTHPAVVFNLAFSATPWEAPFAGALELLGVPYTGSGPFAIALANDKVRSRVLLDAAGIRVPPFVELAPTDDPMRSLSFEPPFIVKPALEGNSWGIHANSVVDSAVEVRALGKQIWQRFGCSAVCDAFIVGREFQVGLVESSPGVFATTAIVELHFAGAPPGRGFKSEAVGGKRRRVYEVTLRVARLPRAKLAEMSAIACAAARTLDLLGYAKIDLRLDDRGRVVVLEANANPGIWSGLTMWRRPRFGVNLQRIIHAAQRRRLS